MKHNLKLNEQIIELSFELGTGRLDLNGKEIFENDRVKFYASGEVKSGVVLQEDCELFIKNGQDEYELWEVQGVEVIGHDDMQHATHTIRLKPQVKELDCELGSNAFDKNGKEIFEGDKIKYGDQLTTTKLNDGTFWFLDGNIELPLGKFFSPELEVVEEDAS